MAKSYEMIIVGRFIVGINSGLNAGLCPIMHQILGTEEKWPILFGLIIIPAIFMLVAFPFCPESPKYVLICKKDMASAEKALAWLRGTEDVQEEMDEMLNEAQERIAVPKVTLKEMWTNGMLRQPLIISVVVMLSQQFSGINAIVFFSTSIFYDCWLFQ
ncbi:hypothetical protein CEXT_578551 [Caerostris extrusa]|uniref:Major facilitator superfamily (MFS) profile domain-containing protein n=1 Tax=Caerostris extrusa TaxID=172846 RepID=A0AAV4MRG6_CAEEX|nr:hypothetical protein CEXT_578551 [Caerostris extrusa]